MRAELSRTGADGTPVTTPPPRHEPTEAIAAALSADELVATVGRGAGTLMTDLSRYALTEMAAQQPGVRVRRGVVAATTGRYTGRSPNDKFIVADPATDPDIWWDNANAMSREDFDRLLADMVAAADGQPIHRERLRAGADPANRLEVDVLTQSAWHALFIRNLLIEPGRDEADAARGAIAILHLPSFRADPDRHGTRSQTCIALDLANRIVAICGTAYAGEIKKAVFSLFNHVAVDWDVLPMHCSANVGPDGDTALFFGLSGTGKTTLSTAPDRALVGDDEHGWGAEGIFNVEGGCYAKALGLDAGSEPEIFEAAARPGAILENVVVDPDTGEPDYRDGTLTENTRIAYPLSHIPNRVDTGLAPAPRNIVFLTADAFGVLPPVARLTGEQMRTHFLSGYTAKVAGTERGVCKPQATFSACFGAPFLPRHPTVYAQMLARRVEATGAACWLINTGWTAGPYGVGYRIPLFITRRILAALLDGTLAAGKFRTDPVFDLAVPLAIDGVPSDILDPAAGWSDRDTYEATANRLKAMFADNLARFA